MIFKNRRHMVKESWIHTLSGILIISFLLFFSNILLLVSHQIKNSRQQVQEKLGMYLYITDSSGTQDSIYSLTMDMKDEMEESGLEVTFYSKDEAFDLLEKRLPNVIGNLEKYGIKNPLPSTMYVLFENKIEYEALKNIVLRYEDIIINLDEALGSLSFSTQESRVAHVINMMNGIQYLSYFLVGITVVIILTFLFYLIQINFFRFQKQIEVEKLLGASYRSIMASFLLFIFVILVVSFLLVGGYLSNVLMWLNTYFLEVFSQSVYSLLPTKKLLIQYGIGEILSVIFLGIFFSSIVLWRLIRKV